MTTIYHSHIMFLAFSLCLYLGEYPHLDLGIPLRPHTCHAHELRSGETPKREANGGLFPWWPPALGWWATTWKGQRGGRPKEEEGEEKGRVMVVVVVKVIELYFEGEVKRKVMEMMMKVMFEIKVEVMGVVIWW